MPAGSWFHLAGTRDVKVYFLMSSLDLGTYSLQGSTAVLVIAHAQWIWLTISQLLVGFLGGWFCWPLTGPASPFWSLGSQVLILCIFLHMTFHPALKSCLLPWSELFQLYLYLPVARGTRPEPQILGGDEHIIIVFTVSWRFSCPYSGNFWRVALGQIKLCLLPACSAWRVSLISQTLPLCPFLLLQL